MIENNRKNYRIQTLLIYGTQYTTCHFVGFYLSHFLNVCINLFIFIFFQLNSPALFVPSSSSFHFLVQFYVGLVKMFVYFVWHSKLKFINHKLNWWQFVNMSFVLWLELNLDPMIIMSNESQFWMKTFWSMTTSNKNYHCLLSFFIQNKHLLIPFNGSNHHIIYFYYSWTSIKNEKLKSFGPQC